MMPFRRGDILLARYDYSDGSGSKLRPVYVISSDQYNESRRKAIVGVITSRIDANFVGDLIINDWKAAGLHHPSCATSVIRAIDLGLIEKRLGSLSEADLRGVESELRNVLGL